MRLMPTLTVIQGDAANAAAPSADALAGRLTLRPNEAAALLGVSRRSIERAIASGKLRSTRGPGGRLIRAADVYALAGEAA